MLEFVDKYKRIRVGAKVKVKELFMMPGRRQVPLIFLNWVLRYRNVFTVVSIQKGDDMAIICLEEIAGFLEYDQIVPLKKNTRVLNWHREKKF